MIIKNSVSLKNVLNNVTHFLKYQPLHTCLFKNIYDEMDSTYTFLLIKVLRLSQGRILTNSVRV